MIGVLQVAFVQGRLAQDEFEARIGQTLMSRTYLELSVVTADLPPLLVGSQLPRMTAVRPDRRPKKSAAFASAFLRFKRSCHSPDIPRWEQLSLCAARVEKMKLLLN